MTTRAGPGGQTPGEARAADAEAEAAPDPGPRPPLPAAKLVGTARAWEMMFEDMMTAGVAANTSSPGAVEHVEESLENLARGRIEPGGDPPEHRTGTTGTGAPNGVPPSAFTPPDSKLPPRPVPAGVDGAPPGVRAGVGEPGWGAGHRRGPPAAGR